MNHACGTTLKFSVIVVSHKRPWWLRRCLKALRQLDHDAFEIIVVADTQSLQQLAGDYFKYRAYDVPNISQARNIGIAAASGDICAFVDDDTAPEPMWLHYFEEAFFKTGADAVVGYVRGRNGISFQSKVQSVDVEGETHAEHAPESMPVAPDLPQGHALKLVGTNAAFRRDALLHVKGFDPAYAFFLDDTDISLRLSNAGLVSAVAPLAEVHHAFAPSNRRTAQRAPQYLGDIGQSTAVFLRRHQGISQQELFERMQLRERMRLLRHMVQGTCEPKDVRTVLESLSKGWDEGLKMNLPALQEIKSDGEPFRRITPIKGHIILSSRLLLRRKSLRKASELAESGKRVSFFSFSLTPVRHHVRYSESGVWVQTGGQFGRSNRKNRVFRWCRFANRKKIEIGRIAKQRGI